MQRSDRKEARVYPRVALRASVDFQTGANFYLGHTKDISLGGVFIETRAEVAVGMPITLRLNVLGKPLAIPAEIMWVMSDEKGTSGIGARFFELSPEEKKRIQAFMMLRAPMAFDLEAKSDDDKA